MMNRFFKDFVSTGHRFPLIEGTYLESKREPFMDVRERDNEIMITAEMPGVDKNDITINITENSIEISTQVSGEEKKEENEYIYKERMERAYYRAFTLPSPVNPDNAKASYKNGVLEITIPKADASKKTSVKIE
jgi:HSP20 family protein